MKNENSYRKKLIKYIRYICDEEISKPIEEKDVDIISGCVCLLLELEGKTVALTEEEINERVARIPFSD